MGSNGSAGQPPNGATASGRWSYEGAFSRNLGLVTAAEQQRLRESRIAIVGMGGVGGVHLTTLARIGVSRFNIADPDSFEIANFNRQCGATTRSLGRSKVEVMAEEVRAINPEVELRLFRAVTPENVREFLDGARVLIDGIDFFELAIRRLVFREARRRGLWAVTAAPLGFSTAWLTFSPTGMSFDDYFDINDAMDRLDQLIAFLLGLAPKATYLPYMDLSRADTKAHRGPSAGLACQLCSGVATAEAVKILLDRSPLRPAPHYFQFDAYRYLLRSGKLRGGNRHPLQRLKRWLLRKRLVKMGWGAAVTSPASGAGQATPVAVS
jgi:molybdopterin/thiamine biosynthesis adenylyltransferase